MCHTLPGDRDVSHLGTGMMCHMLPAGEPGSSGRGPAPQAPVAAHQGRERHSGRSCRALGRVTAGITAGIMAGAGSEAGGLGHRWLRQGQRGRMAVRDTGSQDRQELGRASGQGRTQATHEAQGPAGVLPSTQREKRRLCESEQVSAGAGEAKGRLGQGKKDKRQTRARRRSPQQAGAKAKTQNPKGPQTQKAPTQKSPETPSPKKGSLKKPPELVMQ